MQTEEEKKAWKEMRRRLTMLETQFTKMCSIITLIYSELDIELPEDEAADELLTSLGDPDRHEPLFHLDRLIQKAGCAS